MASKAKPRPKRKKPAPNPMADLGLFDIPNLDLEADDDDSDVDEGSLESELAALMSGQEIGRPKRVPKAPPPALDIERLAADCLKDDEDEDDEDDEDLLANEDLLKELQKLSPDEEECADMPEEPPISHDEKRTSISKETSGNAILQELQDRLKLYNDAIQAAKEMGDNSKVRRYGRAVKTLESMIKVAKGGGVVNQEDVPPVVSIPKASAAKRPENQSTIEMPKTVNDAAEPKPNTEAKPLPEPLSEMDTSGHVPSSLTALLMSRKNEYKMAALNAKKAGNKELAMEYMRTAKGFDAVIEAANANQPVDLSNLPPPIGSKTITSGAIPSKKTEDQVQNSSAMEIAALAAAENDEEQPAIFSAPPAPSSILECLQQRLEKYKSTKEAAQSEGNSGKVRRLDRIVKSYETAIKNYKAGRKVDYDDLPCPPGFGPFPVEGNSASTPSTEDKPKEPKSTPAAKASAAPNPVVPTKKATAPQVPVRKPKVQRTTTFTGEKQLEFLLERQKLFREAAISSKQEGNIQQAKEYLKMMKGFDSMIEAVKMGLPIDTTQIPTPPQLESSDFVIVDALDCEENNTSDLSLEELFETLIKDLTNQLEICRRNKEFFLHLGDVTSASKFEKLALESKKDLSVVQHLKKTNQSVPKFHYETRLFSMVVCNTELADNELEVTVARGINLPGKQDELDSFVRVEFPIPNETPQTAKTHTIKDTNNPEFEETFKFEINRKSRSQLRLFKRHSLKLEVFQKGSFLCCSGFLRSDKLLGTVSVKLLDLESKCIVHDSFNLMEGRKNIGGSLEVKIRIRDPLLGKQVEEVKEKWLIIGS
ncbi:coiled-coil and C2 domain-containing protein 1-like isoform X2 [Parasteatoda tepidariorum]|uniref:coiled-coil and C2 domain-containing protein 1-like isoform X2 n=1 Tax=Parasteatoda tepidariorum TaxID=114398 RepID=UPI00077FC4A6|nr:coiled-coil and C2 domain-containing protein 1-like isoform X2 [Parasteatoda tepidariorum]